MPLKVGGVVVASRGGSTLRGEIAEIRSERKMIHFGSPAPRREFRLATEVDDFWLLEGDWEIEHIE